MLDDHSIDVPPARNMLVVRNDDRPGVIGRVGTILGDAGINIADMARRSIAEATSALMVVVDHRTGRRRRPWPTRVAEGVLSVHVISRS